jgi:hypothetical protein
MVTTHDDQSSSMHTHAYRQRVAGEKKKILMCMTIKHLILGFHRKLKPERHIFKDYLPCPKV